MGPALQVIYNVMREKDGMTGQPPSLRDGGRGRTDPSLTKPTAVSTGPRHTTRAQSLLHRLETETYAIEQAIRSLYKNSSQHHIAQRTGIKILQTLTPEGYSHSERTPEDRTFFWIHPSSGTFFDTLPDLVDVSIHITYWHRHTETWQTRDGTISVPISGRAKQLVQITLWKHPYIDMEPFLQGITAHKITRDIRMPVSLNSDIRVMDASFHQFNLHFQLPHWDAGHSHRFQQSKNRDSLEEGSPPDERSLSREDITLEIWTLDAGATLGRSGNQILGIDKMIPYPTVLVPPQ